MGNYYTCRNCNGTMNGQFCEDCGFDEMQFLNEWDEAFHNEPEQDQEAA